MRRKLLLKASKLLRLLFLCASHAPVTRDFLRWRYRGRDSFGSHVGGECCVTILCVPAQGGWREDSSPMDE